MISRKKKFIFVHIPKTGGNSIQNVLKKYSEDKINVKEVNSKTKDLERFGVSSLGHIHKHSSIGEYYKNWNKRAYGGWELYYKFTVVRNPWDRAVSNYFHILSNPQHHSWLTTTEKFYKPDFKKFITGENPSVHPFSPEIKRYLSIKNKLVVNVLKFEDLKSEFQKVCDKLGLVGELPHVNKSKHVANRLRYVDYYDDELIQIIATRFYREIKTFGYTFKESR